MSDQALQESITQARAQTRNAILCANHQWEAIVEDLLGRLGIAQKALEAKENHISLR